MDSSSNQSHACDYQDAITLGETPDPRWIAKALKTRTSAVSHRSNLENVLQQFSHATETIETIEPFARPPWWALNVKTRIEVTKEAAKSAHDEIQQRPDATVSTIYTDGSGIDKKIGAAAYALMSDDTSRHHQ